MKIKIVILRSFFSVVPKCFRTGPKRTVVHLGLWDPDPRRMIYHSAYLSFSIVDSIGVPISFPVTMIHHINQKGVMTDFHNPFLQFIDFINLQL